jgi:hypothetical protein
MIPLAESAPITHYVGAKRRAAMKRKTAKKTGTIYGRA